MIRKLAIAGYPIQGLKLMGTPLQLRRAAVEIVGDDCVKGVRVADVRPDGSKIPGSERVVEADFVCMAGGLYPLAELAALAGCPFRFVPPLGGHVPEHDERMRTPLPGLFVAGNITGVESAKVAMAQGRAAGLSMALEALGGSNTASPMLQRRLSDALAAVRQARREALIQFQPGIAEARQTMYAELSHSTNDGPGGA